MGDSVHSPEALRDCTDFSGAVSLQYSQLGSKELGTAMYVVTRGFVFNHEVNGRKRAVHVPVGYLTDIASVPRIFWIFIPPEGQYGQAAVLHDYLCEYMSVLQDGVVVDITRAEVDATLNCAMYELNVPTWKRWCIYNAVCLYRIVMSAKKPIFSKRKLALEDQIRESFAETGEFM